MALDKIPRVSGAGYGQVCISPRSKTVLDKASKEAEQNTGENLRIGLRCSSKRLKYGTLIELEKGLEEENKRLTELQSCQKMLKEEVDSENVAEMEKSFCNTLSLERDCKTANILQRSKLLIITEIN